MLDEKIHGLGPWGCGPRRPGPPWTGSHCRKPELVRAWPLAPPAVEVTRRGVGEEEGSTGVPVPGSPGLVRRRRGSTMMVKVAVVGVPVRGSLKLRERRRRE
jgi:hypothetical protein